MDENGVYEIFDWGQPHRSICLLTDWDPIKFGCLKTHTLIVVLGKPWEKVKKEGAKVEFPPKGHPTLQEYQWCIRDNQNTLK